MYEDFTAKDPLTSEAFHCQYQCLIMGIATRHSDTVDVKFIINGHEGLWLGLPHPFWMEFKKRTGQPLTDRMAVDLAGLFLKHQIESGAGAERSHWNDISVEDLLALAAELHWLPEPAVH